MAVKLLDSLAFAGYEGRPQNGLLAHSFWGRIEVNEEEPPVSCLIKAYRDFVSIDTPAGRERREDRSLLNEILGYSLAKSCGYAVPDTAGVILLKREQIPNVPAWLTEDEWLCWFTSRVDYPDLNLHYSQMRVMFKDAERRVLKELRESGQLADIVAFDDWLQNPDRNLGNLLRTGDGKYVLIDHGRLFGSELWTPLKLKNVGSVENIMENLLGSDHTQSLPFKSRRYLACQNINKALKQTGLAAIQPWVDACFGQGTLAAKAVTDHIQRRADPDQAQMKIGLLA